MRKIDLKYGNAIEICLSRNFSSNLLALSIILFQQIILGILLAADFLLNIPTDGQKKHTCSFISSPTNPKAAPLLVHIPRKKLTFLYTPLYHPLRSNSFRNALPIPKTAPRHEPLKRSETPHRYKLIWRSIPTMQNPPTIISFGKMSQRLQPT